MDNCGRRCISLRNPHPTYVFSVVAARANGARRLRRFRVAQALGRCGKARVQEIAAVKRPEVRAPAPILVRTLNRYPPNRWKLLAVSCLRPWSFICGSISIFRFTGCGLPFVSALKTNVGESKARRGWEGGQGVRPTIKTGKSSWNRERREPRGTRMDWNR